MRQICVRFASDSHDHWAELYWKKQPEGSLTKEKENELKKLEKENMKTINEVYNTLKEDVKKIKSHKWIKVVEGENV